LLISVLLIILSFFRKKNSATTGGSYRSQRSRRTREQRRRKLTVRDLGIKLEMSKTELVRHNVQYETTTIPKRSGGKRVLHVPDRASKHLQRKLLKQLIERLPIHDNVHGFRKGRSIVDNAAEHIGQEVIVKLDIVDFFPSTNSERVESAFKGAGFDKSSAKLLTRLTCYEGGLPQGAPTSPALSNYVNKNMDVKLADAALRRSARYTRYADDITFSFAEYSRDKIHDLLISTGKILQYYGYRQNNRKKRIIRQHRQQLVTGLVVNERVNLPRKTRRWLRSVKHRMETGGEATLTAAEFRGWLSLLKMVDGDSRLLAFLDSPKPKEVDSVTPALQIGDKISDADGHSSLSDIASSVVHQGKSVTERESLPTNTPSETPLVGAAETIFPTDGRDQFLRLARLGADGNLTLIQIVEALDRVDKYSTNRKEAEKNLVGSEYLIDISVSSIGRTFSFSLPEDYRDGQTLKGTLSDGGLSLELYCNKQVGSELSGLRFPTQLKVLVRVVQWNAIFKRIEAVVLHATR
jgi:RNA-directed DNA polymerase